MSIKINKKFYTQLLEWVKKNTQPPIHVQIVPTNFCNVACIFCWRTWEKENFKKNHLKDKISNGRYLEIVKEICGNQKLRPKLITITGGGEPMIKKELVLKMVREIKKYSIYCEIVTNGTLLDDVSAKKLVSYKLDNLCISINAANEKLADFHYGKVGSFKRTLKGIEKIVKWKNKLKSEFPKVVNTIVVTKYNYKEICNMVEQASRMQVNTLNVRWVCEPYCNGKPGPLTMPAEKYGEFIEEFNSAKKLAKEKGIAMVSDFTLEDLKKFLNLKPEEDTKKLFSQKSQNEGNCTVLTRLFKFLKQKNAYQELCNLGICTFPFYELFIDAGGFASGCGTLAASSGGFQEKIAEDVTKKSIFDIWYGKRLNRLRVFMLLRKFLKSCEKCNVINIVKISREWGVEK